MRCALFACLLHLATADSFCDFKRVSTTQTVLCHGIGYDLTVPPQCLDGSKKCGIVVDVHGGFMNSTMEEALTELTVNAATIDAMTLQPSAVPGCTPGFGGNCMWPASSSVCVEKTVAAIKDIETIFDTDSERYYIGGSSQGGICTNAMMLSEHADMFAGYTIGAAGVGLPSKKRNFMKFIGRHDPINFPFGYNDNDVQKVLKAWRLTEHTLLSSGKMHEHHLWTDAAKSVNVELVVHNYTEKVTGGHCSPGGHDDAAHGSFFPDDSNAHLSCPQPEPKKAERGCWQGEQTVAQYARIEGLSPTPVPAPTPAPAPPSPGPACRTPDVTDACWKSMGDSCSESGGESCLLCLAGAVAKTKAAGCPQTPAGKVARCFCSKHLDETIV